MESPAHESYRPPFPPSRYPSFPSGGSRASSLELRGIFSILPLLRVDFSMVEEIIGILVPARWVSGYFPGCCGRFLPQRICNDPRSLPPCSSYPDTFPIQYSHASLSIPLKSRLSGDSRSVAGDQISTWRPCSEVLFNMLRCSLRHRA